MAQLGLGDYKDTHIPVRVGIDNDWAAIACGADASLALKKDGSLWTWGAAGTEHPNRCADDWAAIACGFGYSLALKNDGSLWAWGLNNLGQLGLGDHRTRDVPRGSRDGSREPPRSR